jgi:hypothetical protein
VILIEVGDAVLLVGDPNDFCQFLVGIFHSYNYNYV